MAVTVEEAEDGVGGLDRAAAQDVRPGGVRLCKVCESDSGAPGVAHGVQPRLGTGDSGQVFNGGRDLDHTNVGEAQNGIINWLNDTLKTVDFTSLRFASRYV